ncbi:MAG: hypothetical protein DRR16_26105 [Candidatus Parabeggiatoa sp. nov. 3]|nr:MAG: hypothetical protein DRR00_29200 [Gammaproteobacteria bacterium]RKZ57151.1 MAG: hypothetical protein DRQ99_27380 [Gammaproteobacteria bacterium]RKZ79238.1 MAG: hypothetical protein DRR16_26105 [Gammaproteobacteria bacterium]
MNKLNEEQLLAFLTSGHSEEINKAIKYLFEQGISSLDFLQSLEGQKEFCVSNLLGYEQWWCTAPIPPEYILLVGPRESLTEKEKEESITVEVVSLYLISAIYSGSLTFYGSPFLVDVSLPKNDCRGANKEEYIARGFHSARKWIRKCHKVGLEALREQKEHPLKSENLYWW